MTAKYHDELDRYEARMRAEREQYELDERKAQDEQDMRDLVEFLKEFSVTSMAAQLENAGFGSPVWFAGVKEIEF